jgi:hypothetical protein
LIPLLPIGISNFMNERFRKSIIFLTLLTSSVFVGMMLYQPYNALSDADFLSPKLSFENKDINLPSLAKRIVFIFSPTYFYAIQKIELNKIFLSWSLPDISFLSGMTALRC